MQDGFCCPVCLEGHLNAGMAKTLKQQEVLTILYSDCACDEGIFHGYSIQQDDTIHTICNDLQSLKCKFMRHDCELDMMQRVLCHSCIRLAPS